MLATAAAADNRPGWSNGPGCGDPGEGCAPGWTQSGKAGATIDKASKDNETAPQQRR